MTKDQIIVGQKYKHNLNDYTYLGVGRRIMHENKFSNYDANFTDKNLIIFDGNFFIGQMVQDPIDCRDGYWDGFEKID